MKRFWHYRLHWLCALQYYERITVLHPERLPGSGPTLFIVLHRNGAVDGFVYQPVAIAHDALPEICKHYGLRNLDGTEIKITLIWRGLATEMYRVFHQEVEMVAERLRDHDSGLMSLEDLEKIRNGRVPPDEWFRRTLGREPPEDVSYYLEPYKKTPNR